MAQQGGLLLGTAPLGTRSLTLDGRSVAVAPDSRFVVAFDRDAGPNATLIATRDDGATTSLALSVAPRAWRLEQINTPYRAGKSDAEFERLRPAELRRIAAARAIEPQSDGWRQRFRWPVTGRISGLFGAQRIYQGKPGSYHSGVDVARPTGTAIVAPADGVVVLAAEAPFTLEGNLLIMDHGMGLSSAFLHLSRIDVRKGDRVRQGQPIAAIGATGRATGPHMHWGLTWRGSRLDPMLAAGEMPGG